MIRTIFQYKDMKPVYISKNCSRNAIMFFLKDARKDILSLHKQNEKMKEVLSNIAYPMRGTEFEDMDFDDVLEFIQSNFSTDDLEWDK